MSLAHASDGAGALPTRERVVAVEVDGRGYDVRLHVTRPPWGELADRRRSRSRVAGGDASGRVHSPMQGTVLDVKVAEGAQVDAGAVLVVVEAMKMENEITAPRGGLVRGLTVGPGSAVAAGELLLEIDEAES
jgi:acetyl-CoA/propionyl-CoA carboxylase biotin carboxyl carrier protein